MTSCGVGVLHLAARGGDWAGVVTRLALSGSTVVENGAGGELVGTLSMVGTDFIGPVTYSIVSDLSLNFEIVGIGFDELRVKAATTIDFETNPTFAVGLRATDSTPVTPKTFDLAATITVIDINEQPTDIALSANSIPENTLPGSIIGVLSTADVDAGDTHTYIVQADPDNKFAISGDNLIVRAGASFDFETDTSHNVTIRSTDSGGLFTSKPFTINITDIVEAITDITLAPSTIAEDASPGDTIGTLTSTSTNVGSAFTYSIILDADAKFVIAGDQLNVRTGAAFDFEAAGGTSHDVTVRSTSVDNTAVDFDEILTVGVTDINEAPTDITIASGSLDVPEDAADGTTIVTYATTDPDTGDTHTYSLITASSDFELVGNALKVKTGATLTVGTTDLTVRSTDSGGLTFDEVSTVNVTSASAFQISDLTITAEEYDARVGITIGTGVQNWADQGANGNDLTEVTGAKQPAHDAVNNIVIFDGIDDQLNAVNVPMSGADVHLFIVGTFPGGSHIDSRYASFTAGNDWSDLSKPVMLQMNWENLVIKANNITIANTDGDEKDSTLKLIHSEIASGVGTIYVNGVAQAQTGNVTTPLTAIDLIIGNGGGRYTALEARHIVYVRGPMTAQEILNVETLLNANWPI